ncbi:Uncharacterised protein [Chlamydia abortus]|nr:Uncharacterised protein [Chlamydia abortus]
MYSVALFKCTTASFCFLAIHIEEMIKPTKLINNKLPPEAQQPIIAAESAAVAKGPAKKMPSITPTAKANNAMEQIIAHIK